jgi:acetyl-CoA synthetase (ADP-forming)
MTAASSRTLSEVASKRLLARYGVPVLDERTAKDPAGAVEAARQIGFPVVLKLSGDGIAHKTERGLVRLRLADEAAVERAAHELVAAATPDDGGVELLVAPMLGGTRELIAGIHTDEQFGRTVMLGVGGILAEAIADVAFRLVPLNPVDAEDLIDDLGTQALLGPFRGEPPVDRDALVATLLGLSALAEQEPGVVSVDVNPLIVVDGRPVAVDALVETR